MKNRALQWRLRRAGESWSGYARRQVRGLVLGGLVMSPLVFAPVLYAAVWHALHRGGVTTDGVHWNLSWRWAPAPWNAGKNTVEMWRTQWTMFSSHPRGAIVFRTSGEASPLAYQFLKKDAARRFPLLVAGQGEAESYCSVAKFRGGGLAMSCSLHEGRATLLVYGRTGDQALFERTFRAVAGRDAR